MWACIKRVTVDSCQVLGSNFSIEDVISRNIYPEIIARGLRVTKSVLKNLAAVSGDSQLHIKMLATVPGISVNTAKKMIGQQPLISWLNMPKEKLATEIGAKRAEAILDAFKRRLGTISQPVVKAAPLVTDDTMAPDVNLLEPMTKQELDLLATMLK
jgi:5'-3' exonuclease